MPIDELKMLKKEFGNNIESQDFVMEIVSEMVYLATFGLEDPVRPGVKQAIQLIKYGTIVEEKMNLDTKGVKNQVNIRLISGDHLETTLAIAIEAGIITEKEKTIDGIFLTAT